MEYVKKTGWQHRILAFVVVLALVFGSLPFAPQTAQAASNTNSSFVIFIAPGHTPASGATAGGIKEATLNEAVSIKLGEKLQAQGYTVYLTNRTIQKTSLKTVIPASEGPTDSSGQYSYGDQILPAIQQTKAEYDVDVKPNLVLSMHHNSSSSASAKGIEIYYDSRCTPNVDYPHMNYGKTELDAENSKEAASIINDQLKSDLNYISVKSSPIDIKNTSGVKNSICRNCTVPSVLVEAGYMSNSSELSAISSSANQNALVDSLVKAVGRFQSTDQEGPTIGTFDIGAAPTTPLENFALAAYNVSDSSGIETVQFWVYRQEDGTGSYQMIQAKDLGSGTWWGDFSTSLFGGKAGTYIFNIAAYDKAGNLTNSSTRSIQIVGDIEGPTIGSFDIGAAPTTNLQNFALAAYNVDDPSGVKDVQFWVYRQEDGTGSYRMIQGKNLGNGTWWGDFSTSLFGGKFGTYVFNIAAYDKKGNLTNSVTRSIRIKGDEEGPTIGSFDMGAAPKTTLENFALAAYNVSDSSGIETVQFWVYRQEDGTGSYQMIQAKDLGSGTWWGDFSTSLFGGKFGTYVFNIAAYDKKGNLTNSAVRTVEIINDKEGPVIGKFEIGTGSLTTMQSFALAAYNVSDMSGVKDVQFWVYRQEDGTGSYRMIQGRDLGNGTWWGDFSTSLFGGKAGTYVFNVAAYDKKGNLTNSSMQSIEVLGHAIMGTSEVSKQQMINYYTNVTKSTSTPAYIAGAKDEFLRNYGVDANGFPNYYVQVAGVDLEKLIDIYIEEGNEEGVRPDIAFAQMLLETGNLRFSGDVRMNQYNFAGIGATGGGVPGHTFADIRTGVRAQIQHLKAYASAEPLKNACVDPRYDIVIKAYGKASAPSVELLSRKWAADDGQYGDKILTILQGIAGSKQALAMMIESEVYEVPEAALTEPDTIENQEETMPEASPTPSPTSEPSASATPTAEPSPSETAQPSEEPAGAENEIMGEDGAITKEQAIALYQQYAGEDADTATAGALIDLYWEEAKTEGVRPEVAFAIAMQETGFLKYGQDLSEDANNPGGLADKDGRKYVFDSLRLGVRAHVQHLKCYASAQECANDVVDPLWAEGVRQSVQKITDIAKMGYTEPGFGETVANIISEMKGL